MYYDLQSSNAAWNIEILGVNVNDEAPYNALITAGRTLPWLQDTVTNSVWTSWNVQWRDVWILDARNQPRSVLNLTDHDLRIASNYALLRQMLLAAAQLVDSDSDGLPDDWEQLYFGNLNASPSGDSSGNGLDNFTKYAFGLDPTDFKARPPIRTDLLGSADQAALALTFRRRAGAAVDYFVESSIDLRTWTMPGTNLTLRLSPRNLYDGTGTSQVGYSLRLPAGPGSSFVRVRALPHPQ